MSRNPVRKDVVFSMLLLLRKKIKRNLTSRGNIGKVPAILALAPHVDRAVLAQCAAVEPFQQLYQTETRGMQTFQSDRSAQPDQRLWRRCSSRRRRRTPSRRNNFSDISWSMSTYFESDYQYESEYEYVYEGEYDCIS